MELKPGYKQSAVGIVPADWDVAKLGSRATFRTGPFGSNLHKSDYVRDGIPVINPMHIIESSLQPSVSMSVSESAASRLAEFQLRASDIIMGRRGDMGRCAVVAREQAGWLCGTGSVIIRTKDDTDPHFLQRVLASPAVVSALKDASVGTTMTNLNHSTLSSLVIVFPRPEEQRAIAGALSDADALIGALDRLIAKKRDLKHAAMQQLLTGRTRLPGFKGKWKRVRLGEVGTITGAGVDKLSRPGELPVHLLNYLDVYQRDFIYAHELAHEVTATPAQKARCSVKQGDVFFTPSSEVPDDIAVSAVAMEDCPDATYSYHIVRLRLHEPWDLRYRAYAFKTRSFLSQAEAAATGSGTRYTITLPRFRALVVEVPDRDEQTAIGATLFDMDAEIAALEARRDKTRLLKQGMMQELLTGRIRLPIEEAVESADRRRA